MAAFHFTAPTEAHPSRSTYRPPVSDGRLAKLIDRAAASGPPGDSLDIVRALQELQERRREVVVQIDDAMPCMRLAAALAHAGLVIRQDGSPDRLVIREAGRLQALTPELAALLNRIAVATNGGPP